MTALALILLGSSAGLSACRLGANNSEKLSALKSGEIYDEDGVLSVAITSPSEGTLINVASNSSSYAASGTCSIEGAAIQLLIDATAAPGSFICAEGQWTGDFDSTGLTDGAHTLEALITNARGVTKTSASVSFSKDASLPTLAILSPSAGGFINSSTNSATYAVSGSCSDSGQTVQVLVDQAATTQIGGSCNGATWAATISTLSLSVGTHTLSANITNSSGNSKASSDVLVTKDVTAPSAAISSPAASSYVNLGNNSALFAVSGTCNDSSASVQVQVDGGNSGSAASCNGTNWNATISTVALSQGSHTLAARITDVAGNSATSSTVAITQDTQAPTIAISAPATNSYVNLGSNSASFAISGTCSGATENGRTVTIQLNGSNATQSAISCGAGSTWSGTFSTAALGEATHTLTALLADAAGNSTTSTAIALIKDTQAPTVTITRPVAGVVIQGTTNSAAYPVQGACSENTRAVSILVDGVAAAGVASNTCSSGAFAATIDTTGLSNAAHTITATTTDAAGNTGPSSPPSSSVTKNDSLAMAGTFARTSTALDPVTGASAASGVARFVTLDNATGVMVEEGTTNVLAYTESFDNAVWTKSAATIAADAVAAPDGNTTADKLTEDSTTAAHWLVRGSNLTTVGSPTALSVFAKAAGRDWIKLHLDGMGAFFNLSSGTVGTVSSGYSASIKAYPGGWYRCSVYAASRTSGSFSINLASADGTISYAGDGSSGVYLWGAQNEQKAYSTSYIASPSGSQVARSAETLTVPTAGNLTAQEGAIVMRAYADGDISASSSSGNHMLFLTREVSGANDISVYRASGGASFTLRTANGSNTQSTQSAALTGSITPGWHIYAIRYSPSEVSFWTDGVKRISIPNPYLPTTLNGTGYIGTHWSAASQWDYPIDYAAFYQHSPSDDEMIAYTTTGPTGAGNRYDFNGASFTRTSAAYDSNTGVQAASGKERYVTSIGSTGLFIEDTTTNLLTANQSSVETDLTGITLPPVTTSTLTRDTSKAWHGSASLRVDTDGAATAEGMQVAVSNSTQGTYAGQMRITGSGSVSIWLRVVYTDTTSTEGAFSTISLDDTWKKVTPAPVATDSGKSVSGIYLFARTNGAQATTFWIDGLQIELKPYATSWQLGGSTRGAETLTIPMNGIFTKSDWTVVLDFIPTVAQLDSGRYGFLWEYRIDVNNRYSLVTNPTHGTVYLVVNSGGNEINTFHASDAPLQAGTRYRIVGKGNGSTMALFVNGTKTTKGDVAYVEPVGTLPSTSSLGSAINNTQQPVGIYDWFSIHSLQTDATIQGWGSTGTLPAGTLRFEFNNTLGQ